MTAALRPIPIAELLTEDQPLRLNFAQPIAGLDTLIPVQGTIQITAAGPLLLVEAKATTTVGLQCDRCLQSYNHRLEVSVAERIGLGTTDDALLEALDYDAGGISDQLDPQGAFDPEQWIYEQLTLRLPQVSRCGPACPGPERWSSEPPLLDPRWAALRQLGS